MSKSLKQNPKSWDQGFRVESRWPWRKCELVQCLVCENWPLQAVRPKKEADRSGFTQSEVQWWWWGGGVTSWIPAIWTGKRSVHTARRKVNFLTLEGTWFTKEYNIFLQPGSGSAPSTSLMVLSSDDLLKNYSEQTTRITVGYRDSYDPRWLHSCQVESIKAQRRQEQLERWPSQWRTCCASLRSWPQVISHVRSWVYQWGRGG